MNQLLQYLRQLEAMSRAQEQYWRDTRPTHSHIAQERILYLGHDSAARAYCITPHSAPTCVVCECVTRSLLGQTAQYAEFGEAASNIHMCWSCFSHAKFVYANNVGVPPIGSHNNTLVSFYSTHENDLILARPNKIIKISPIHNMNCLEMQRRRHSTSLRAISGLVALPREIRQYITILFIGRAAKSQ